MLLLAAFALVSAGAGTSASSTNVGWGGFGNTPNELRHSPLTQIDKSNVGNLGRVVTVDFHAIDAGVRRGEQSYPVIANGTMYVTTNDDNVWALDATTGKVKWRWQPDNGGVYKNFGIVANRGVALCDGKLFVLTLDMTIVSLNPANGIARSSASASRRPCRARRRTTATRRRARRSARITGSSSAPQARSTACAAS